MGASRTGEEPMFWVNDHLAQASRSHLSEKSWMDACCCSSRRLSEGNCCWARDDLAQTSRARPSETSR